MDLPPDKLALEEQLLRCRRLQSDYPSGITNKHLLELEAELQARLRDLERYDGGE